MGPGREWAAASCSPRPAGRQYQACRRCPALQQVACQRHSSVPRQAATGPGRVGLVFFQELLQPQPDHNLDSVGLATLCLCSAGQTVAGPGQSRGRGLPEGLAAQPEAGSSLKRSPCWSYSAVIPALCCFGDWVPLCSSDWLQTHYNS